MEDLISNAKAAKKRLKGNFWEDYKRHLITSVDKAKEEGKSQLKVKSGIKTKLSGEIKGEVQDEFYLKVKKLLDEEGEVSDAIGRLTDKAVYDKLNYEEKQRYVFTLSSKYLACLNKYRKEKEMGII